MEYHKVSSPALSKKLANGYSFSGKSIYDGVFGGTAKVGSSVVEDYGQIFGGSSSCSIPILDVPELNERKVSVDVSTSKLDYSKIFGGFGEFNFAVSHEELSAQVAQPNKRESFIEEGGTPPKTGSHTIDFSVKNQVLSHEDSYQSLDGVKQLKMSYHKTNQGRKNGINGTTHIAQFHAVPGYTCLIDEVVPSPMKEGNKPSSSVSNDTYHTSSLSGEIMEGKPSWKAESAHPPDGAKKQASNDGVKSKNRSNRSRPNSNEMFFDAYEPNSNEMFFDAYDIHLTTNPSKVLPPSTLPHNKNHNKSDSKISITSKFGMSKNNSSEDAADICSPPYFDEEVDSNSVAAASAAAVKKAIEEAQARIRIAKEIMERKKDGLQNHMKQRFKDGTKLKEGKQSTITDKTNNFRGEGWEKYGQVGMPIPLAGLGTQNAVKASQLAADLEERDKLFSTNGALGEMHEIENRTAPVDRGQEEVNDWSQSVNDCELREENFTMKSFEKLGENNEKLEVTAEAHEQEEIETIVDVVEGACDTKECAEEPKLGQELHDQEEYGKKLRVAGLLEEGKVLFKASQEIESSVKKLRGFQEPTSNEENLEMPELEDNECKKMRILKDVQEWLEKEQKQKEVFKQGENDTRFEDVPKREEKEAATKEIFHHKENDEREEAVCERVQFVKQQKEDCMAEENEVGQNDVNCREESEKTFDEAEEQEKIEVRMHDLRGGKKYEKKLDDNGELGVQEKLIEAEENVKMLRKGNEMIETEGIHKICCEWMEYEQMQAEIDHRAEDEKTRTNQEALEHCENNFEAPINVCEQEKIGILSETLGASGHEENNVSMETTTHKENREVMEVPQASSECQERETESNAFEVANDLEKKEVFEVEIAGLSQVVLELNEIKNQVQDTTEAHSFEYDRVNLGTANMDVRQKQNDPCEKESERVCNAGEQVEEMACEPEEIFEDAEEVEVAIEQEEDESDFEFSEEQWVDNRQNVELTKSPSIFQGEAETTEISCEIKASQNKEKIENYSKTAQAEEREAEVAMQKEGELQKENVRKRDKINEKEKEREKERMAVERAIREARERAFAEARERAERAAAEKATAEAHRRAMAEARGRLEKVSAEANEKTSMEARLKAMRAAVERATAEARERALEKAMFEKATLAARNQAVKSSGASRENGMRPSFASNDSKNRGSEPTRSSGHPNSSNNNVPCSNDNIRVNGESTQRDKASLERDKRTAERAAKALAEKNMRDLLAWKEQAERNRVAEALDADVKRWSSGKAGNLRALLSTLQYILGPDSGWQPIPLTDLVAAAAVKKAYRKATLVVHPDKLQQRGASIQQKYTCEKVFDLLKDAWNKFSAEER